jgi:flagellar hook-associated protein 3 FlgL
MRITLGMMTSSLLTSLTLNSERLLEAENVASSGKRIFRPSDDVPGVGRSLSLRSTLAELDQFERNSGVADSELSVASSALDKAVTALQSVRSLAVQAASAATTPEARAAIVAQLDSLSGELAAVANSQHVGKYIFSGSRSDRPAVVANPGGSPPYVYQGDSSQFTIQVSPGQYVTANVTGDAVFNMNGSVAGAPDVFTMIRDLEAKVTAGDVAGISDELTQIDANLNNVVAIRSQIGGRIKRLESNSGSLADLKVSVQDLLSKTEDADLADAVLELQMRQNVYQAAIAAAGKVLQLSLVDYIQ